MRGSITLHSSWKGLLASSAGAAMVIVLGMIPLVVNGSSVGGWLLLTVGMLLLLVVFADYPVASEFDADGVTRRPLLRRQRIVWENVDQLTRTRPGIAAAARKLNPGGLSVKVGWRKYLLVDQCESSAEFEELAEMLAASGHDVGLDHLVRPPVGVDPTWTYRRGKWANGPTGSRTGDQPSE